MKLGVRAVLGLLAEGALLALAWKFFPQGARFVLQGFATLRGKFFPPRFVLGFATLLERPVISRRGLRSYLSGVEQVGGDYQDRPVVLVLHPSGNEELGYLIVGMEAIGASVTRTESSGGLQAWIHDTGARNALDDLELRYKLKLSLQDRWLKATYQPTGFIGFYIFPGRFDKEHWNNVLRAMHRVVVSLEDSPSTARVPGSEP